MIYKHCHDFHYSVYNVMKGVIVLVAIICYNKKLEYFNIRNQQCDHNGKQSFITFYAHILWIFFDRIFNILENNQYEHSSIEFSIF